MDAATNFAKVTVDGGYDDSVTEVDVIFSASNPFPVPPFNAVWWNATDYPDPADDPGVEIVRVTAQVDITLTITRAQEGTGAQDHNVAGKTYKLIAGLTALAMNDLRAWVLPAADSVSIGDVLDAGNGTRVSVDDVAEKITLNAGALVAINGKLSNDRTASASTLGTVTGKMPIHDSGGTVIGYVPLYDSIT